MCPASVFSQSRLDSIRQRLEQAPVQEKVYLHLDNNCYFKGDTIWYRSYVVRADNLGYTDMSHILYVELLSPDGLVVERQQIIVSPDGYGDGNFALKDSLYSGYYELRAYTRWMLNFRVTEHPYGRKDREYFYNRQMARDFFRQFGTVYSRVVPVYERPDSLGDYAQKYIVNRPKTRVEKELKENLQVDFYPEGGHLIAGTRCRVAFEVHNEEGEQVDIEGIVTDIPIRTTHQGRGVFTVDVPQDGRLRARFTYHGKDYSFALPKAETVGCALQLSENSDSLYADIALQGFPEGRSFALAVLCRGILKSFQTISGSGGRIHLDTSLLPTGVNDLIVLDEDGRLLADRLFFVNHHDIDLQPVTVTGIRDEYQPFEAVNLQFQAPAAMKHLSISVRDGANEELTYDTGTILTDLLLSSELKGFVAYPDYYFEADDAEHRQALDLLMMVQGWRRYDFAEITSNTPLRYQPEQYMTIEGTVYPVGDRDEIEAEEVRYWPMGIFGYRPSLEMANQTAEESTDIVDEEQGSEMVPGMDRYQATTPDDLVAQSQEGTITVEQVGTAIYVTDDTEAKSAFDPFFGIEHKGLGKRVTLEGELVLNEEVATVKMETDDRGHFVFDIPAYYGQGILFLRAFRSDLSEEKRQKRLNKGMLDETAWPDFYVKRDLFFPVFAKKYDYYQCHQPEVVSDDTGSSVWVDTVAHISKMDATLREVKVQAKRRRGRQAIDYSKPAYVFDAYDLYNLATDRGLSFGRFDPQRFPMQISMALLGNYNSERALQVMARLNDQDLTPYVFYRNYDPGPTVMEQFRSDIWIFERLKLNRQDEIRLFTDFELRNEDKHVEMQSTVADVTLDYMLMPDDTKRYTYRDRRIILDGMYEPDDFYHPDYSHKALSDDVKDYRRTLYWNPNARLDADGRFTASFYNNGKPTRIRVSTAGIISPSE